MDEFNRLGNYSKTLKLKELKEGIYNLISLRKIQTKYGDACVVKLDVDDVEKEYFLKKRHGDLPERVIKKINIGNYTFHYKGLIDGEYVYELNAA